MGIRKLIALFSLCVSIAVIFGCGGGTAGSANPGSTVATGVITASGGSTVSKEIILNKTAGGSIQINGIDYSLGNAKIIKDEDDVTLSKGMVVTIKSQAGDQGSPRAALEISCDHLLKGPVQAIDTASGSLVVLGQQVITSDNTVYYNITGLESLSTNDLVVVSGYIDADGQIQATRIERKNNPFIPNKTPVKLIGTVTGINGQSLTIGSIAVTSIHSLPEHLATGSLVKVHGTVAATSGPITAARLSLKSPELEEAEHAEIEGIVANLSAADGTFTVSGLTVLAKTLNLSGLAENDRVEIEGRLVNEVLLAFEIKIKHHGPGRRTTPTTPTTPTTTPTTPIEGQGVFEANCAGCHTLAGSSKMNLSGKSSAVSIEFPNPGAPGHMGITLSATDRNALMTFLI